VGRRNVGKKEEENIPGRGRDDPESTRRATCKKVRRGVKKGNFLSQPEEHEKGEKGGRRIKAVGQSRKDVSGASIKAKKKKSSIGARGRIAVQLGGKRREGGGSKS